MKITFDVNFEKNPDRNREIRDYVQRRIRALTLLPKGYMLLWVFGLFMRIVRG